MEEENHGKDKYNLPVTLRVIFPLLLVLTIICLYGVVIYPRPGMAIGPSHVPMKSAAVGPSHVPMKSPEVSERVKQKLELQNLTASLQAKLRDAQTTPDLNISTLTCSELNITNYNDSCNPRDRRCLRTNIPPEPKERIASLLPFTNSLSEHNEALEFMRSQVKGEHDVIVASAVSSNHFKEVQAMLENFHRVLYPSLKNVLLIIYDIGLSKRERGQLEKHCKCTVATFPFHLLPRHVASLLCYTWKPFIIAAHLEQADVIIWTDTSIRFTHSAEIHQLIQKTKQLGVQVKTVTRVHPLPYYTLPMVFETFGDSPCAYTPFQMVEGNFIALHREALVWRAVVQPWLYCASREDCMCPPGFRDKRYCWYITQPLNTIGMRHCFDQSALTLILAKLFREKFRHFVVDTDYVLDTARGNQLEYFKQLEKA